jgi:hypothetical protein
MFVVHTEGDDLQKCMQAAEAWCEAETGIGGYETSAVFHGHQEEIHPENLHTKNGIPIPFVKESYLEDRQGIEQMFAKNVASHNPS